MDRQEAERQADAIIAAARSHSRQAMMQTPVVAAAPSRRRLGWALARAVVVMVAAFLALDRFPLFRDASPVAAAVFATLLTGIVELLILVGALRRDVALLRAELGDVQRHLQR